MAWLKYTSLVYYSYTSKTESLEPTVRRANGELAPSSITLTATVKPSVLVLKVK